MVFNSTIFVLLFLFVFIQYWFLPIRGKHTLIIIASVLFYTWYSIPFFVLFVSVLIINYIVAMKFVSQVENGIQPTRQLLWLIVAIDLSILGFFKYFYLFASTAGSIFSVSYLVNIRANLIHDFGLQIILPIGISFYIFQVIAFVVDCYRGVVNQKIYFRRFAVFILFFPQFVAGPILRATDFLPQIDQPTLTAKRVREGLLLLLLGAVKKILIADRIGAEIGAAWRSPAGYDATVYLLLPAAFLGQIYADFSGYTDMARGMGKLLGYELPENFKGPFLARSMSELWTRWHVTLSSWLRDYIYIPLGGSRGSEFRTSVNLFITMALGGFWHGATWNMLLWGIIIGVVLIFERILRVRKVRILPEGKLFDTLRVAITFGLFCFSAVFFAAPGLDQSSTILKGIVTWQRGNPLPGFASAFFLFVLAFLLNVPGYHESIRQWIKQRPKLQTASISVGIFVVGFLIFLYGDAAGAFIYFAF
ncbi:MAG: MBOAT family protein [Leptonema sp. (in: Bacteria)]|nr:MBOAT family protein [Leptonema sp. (in: bacteria)]